MSRFSLLHQCHASFPTQAPLQSYFTEYVHFFSSIHHSSKYLFFHFFSSSFQHQLHFSSLPEKQAWLCLFFFSFLQITTFCLLLPLITNAVWKFAPLSFPRYGFCSQSCNDFPLLQVPCFPLCFPIIYCYCAQIVPAWPYISACQISLDLAHLTFPPQFCNLITHLFATGCTNSCCLFTVKIFNTIRILLWLDTTVPSRVV